MAEPDRSSVETRDVPPRVMSAFLLRFALFAGAAGAGLHLFVRSDRPWTFHRLGKPEPVLQVSPAAEYAAFLKDKRAELTGYGWRDREGGLARIPIGEAMRLVRQGHRAAVDLPREDCTGAACPGATPSARTIP